MSKLFEATEIKGMRLANRFVRSATWEGMATEEGACTPRLKELMRELARGRVGMIITSHAYVRKDGQAGSWQLGIYEDGLEAGLKEMTRAVHDEGGRIVLQLSHAGFFANPKLTGTTPLAASQVEGFAKSPRRVMTARDIGELAKAFGRAAGRAREAGFDGVEIHAAHGYLLSQFLSPVFNRRADDYGGSVGNRARALLEVLGEVRGALGDDYPVLGKMNSEDFLEGGLSLGDSVKVGKLLEEGGIDAIELSGGTLVSGKLSPSRAGISREENEAYFRGAARAFKEVLRVPLMLVGGIRSFSVADRLVEEGVADYISMSRPLIREPHLVKRWAEGDLRRAACLSDNQCFGPAMAGEGVTCVVEKKERDKKGAG
jgi:2,4-dienoyl-CoA reductase-like NADH-dependent reductase (Old Yellow Enzyme family)